MAGVRFRGLVASKRLLDYCLTLPESTRAVINHCQMYQLFTTPTHWECATDGPIARLSYQAFLRDETQTTVDGGFAGNPRPNASRVS